MTDRLRLYTELAEWWPLLSPPSHYVEEAAHLLTLLEPSPAADQTLLELGCGGGSLASHLGRHYRLTLTDRSAPMLAVSRRVNPTAEHLEGDMRTLDLGRQFDRVLIHDAIMYATTERDLLASLMTARRHCHPAGRVIVLPDHVAETYAPGTGTGGEDAPDGRGLRYLEWWWDPDASDTHYEAAWAFLLRERSGDLRVEIDRHLIGIFPRQTWLSLFERVGLRPEVVVDPWKRDVFIGVPA